MSRQLNSPVGTALGHHVHHDELHGAMSLAVPLLQEFPLGLVIFIAVSAAAAAWAAQDARARFAGGPREGWGWAGGTLVGPPNIWLPLLIPDASSRVVT